MYNIYFVKWIAVSQKLSHFGDIFRYIYEKMQFYIITRMLILRILIFNVKKRYYINIVAYKYKTSHIMIGYHLLC